MFWYFEIFDEVEEGDYSRFGIMTPIASYLIHSVKLCVCYLEKLMTEVPEKGAIVVDFS